MQTFSLFLFGEYEASVLDTLFANIFIRTIKNLQIHSKFKLSFSVFASDSLFKNLLLLEELELLVSSISIINVPVSIEESQLLPHSNSLDNVLGFHVDNFPAKVICFENLKHS